MNTSDIFTILEAAQVSIFDFSRLTGCGRNTLQRWKREGDCAIRDPLRLKIALATAARLQRATEAGRLPLKERYLLTQRIAVLQRIIAQS